MCLERLSDYGQVPLQPWLNLSKSQYPLLPRLRPCLSFEYYPVKRPVRFLKAYSVVYVFLFLCVDRGAMLFCSLTWQDDLMPPDLTESLPTDTSPFVHLSGVIPPMRYPQCDTKTFFFVVHPWYRRVLFTTTNAWVEPEMIDWDQ